MNSDLLSKITACAQSCKSIPDDMALEILNLPGNEIYNLCKITAELTESKFASIVSLCAIVNAKSAPCGEDCTFCAQSAHNGAKAADTGGLLNSEQILDARQKAKARLADRFSPVTTGYALDDKDVDSLCETISQSADTSPAWCGSLGCLTQAQLQKLKDAGLKRYHHNIETARSFYPSICTTHSFDQRVKTIMAAKAVGLEICCGGIIGLGESISQRVEMARILNELSVDSIALNFLLPAENTPLQNQKTLDKDTILRTIAMMRLVNPESELRIAAGRSLLGPDQYKIFSAGASGMMIGDYLTMCGQNTLSDTKILQMAQKTAIRDPK